MRVWLDNSVLVQAWQPEVSAIIALGFIGRHRVLPSDDKAYSAWIKQFDKAHRDLYQWVWDESAAKEAAGGAAHQILVTNNTSRGATPVVKWLSPPNSLGLLLQPFRLVLENARNDWRFLRRMATTTERQCLDDLFDKGWLVTSGGGQGELTKEVERICRGLEGDKLAAAFFDSDSTEPGKLSRNTELAVKACQDARILFYCLARRAIENYLPLESLRLWACSGSKSKQADRRERVVALAELKKRDNGRRDCFSMKDGCKTMPPDMDSSEWYPLKAGFGENIAELFSNEQLVTEQHLRDDGGFDEVNPFVRRLIAAAR
jgi:hypothetical protein